MSGILYWILFGLLVGVIVSFIKGNQGGIVMDIVIGILGALVGGYLGRVLGIGDVSGFNITSIVLAVVGALILLAIVNLVTKGGNKGL